MKLTPAYTRLIYSTGAILVLCVAMLVAEKIGLWHIWGIPRAHIWFLDFHALIAAATCDSLGYDVIFENPCDADDRRHV